MLLKTKICTYKRSLRIIESYHTPLQLFFRARYNCFLISTILRETLRGTSYKIVRLVFRPNTQIQETNCNSEKTANLHQNFLRLQTFSSVAHHLSGPNMHAFTNKLRKKIIVTRRLSLGNLMLTTASLYHFIF